MKRIARPVITLAITLFVTTFLLALFSFSSEDTLVSAARPRHTPTPSPTQPRPKGVNSQAVNNLNPGDTLCLPIQQVVGIQGGQVEGGGSSFTVGGAPIATRWTAYNGPAASNLQAIHTVTYSFVVMADTVPIGSFYRVCMTNITNVVVAFSIQQSEYTNDPPFP